MVMDPFIFIVTYGLFFTYNIFYFLTIDNINIKPNTILLSNNTIPSIQNNTFANILNLVNNQTEQINIKNNELEQINNNFIKKYNQNKNYNYNFFEKGQNCYISDIIIHYKCE